MFCYKVLTKVEPLSSDTKFSELRKTKRNKKRILKKQVKIIIKVAPLPKYDVKSIFYV